MSKLLLFDYTLLDLISRTGPEDELHQYFLRKEGTGIFPSLPLGS
jgi:hypothetical protein